MAIEPVHYRKYTDDAQDLCFVCLNNLNPNEEVVGHTTNVPQSLLHPIHRECALRLLESGLQRCGYCAAPISTIHHYRKLPSLRFVSCVAALGIGLTGMMSHLSSPPLNCTIAITGCLTGAATGLRSVSGVEDPLNYIQVAFIIHFLFEYARNYIITPLASASLLSFVVVTWLNSDDQSESSKYLRMATISIFTGIFLGSQNTFSEFLAISTTFLIGGISHRILKELSKPIILD